MHIQTVLSLLGYLISTHCVCHEATGPPCVTNITAYCSDNNLHKQEPTHLQFIPQVAAPYFLTHLLFSLMALLSFLHFSHPTCHKAQFCKITMSDYIFVSS